MTRSVKDKNYTVLIAEDSVPNQLLLKAYVQSYGWQAICANDGYEAVAMFKKNKFDVCIIDVKMPHMNGLDATKQIRALQKNNIPIIGLFGFKEYIKHEECIDAGMNTYMLKPVDVDELKKEIMCQLEGS